MNQGNGVLLVLEDAERILFRLYHSETRGSLVHTLICACGNSADRRDDPGAWYGWQLLPHPLCPVCGGVDGKQAPYDGPARARYLALVERLAAR